MFIRISDSGGRKYLRLVEAYRDKDGKARQRQVAQLGRLDQLDRAMVDGLIDNLRRFTGCNGTGDTPQQMPLDGEPVFERALEVGPTWVLTELWETLGFKDLLRDVLKASRRSFDVEAAVRLMVFNRLCDPESKLGVLRWLEGVVVPGIDAGELTHQHLLRAMDTLMEHRPAITAKLGERLLPLIDTELSVVFYDLTTIRIHGEAVVEGDIRQFGKSKDVKGVDRQFSLGLVQTADGLPLDFEVFEGNVAEVKTLLPMLRRCVKRYPIRRTIVVADRGLLSIDNLDAVEALEVDGRRLEYIVAVPASRYAEFTDLLDELPFAATADSVREGTSETFGEGRRVIAAFDPKRAKAQAERRQAKLDEMVAFGEKLASKLDHQDDGTNKPSRGRKATDIGAYSRFERELHAAHMAKYFTLGFDRQRFSFELNQGAIDKAATHDGKLVLISNVQDYQPEDLVVHYKSLADIERSFRTCKSELDIAPVHHRKPERLRAHAFICFFALLLHRIMRMRLRASPSTLSVSRALHTLEAIQLHRVDLGTRQLRGLTKMGAKQLELFKHLGVERPTAKAI